MDPKIRVKDVGHFALPNCLYPQYVPRVPEMNPWPQSLKEYVASIMGLYKNNGAVSFSPNFPVQN